MGWLDRLLGRDKEQAPTLDAPLEEKPRPDTPLASPTGEAEGRATDERDDVLGQENRIPPGTS